ncbi:hypothetical protein ACRBEV_09510 [Methylobacterium phyllosphaerae]
MSPIGRLTALGIVGTALVGLGMPLLLRFGDDAFLALACAGGVIAAVAARLEGVAAPRALAIIVGAALTMRLLALFAPPILSTDIFRYVWDGMVQGVGINPYRYVPADPALAFLRDAQVYPFINRADYAVTIYPPWRRPSSSSSPASRRARSRSNSPSLRARARPSWPWSASCA